MKSTIQISDRVTIGCQPSPEEISQLAKEGFRSLINLRVEHEDPDMLSPIDEGQFVKDAGMEYLHLDVSAQQIRPQQVDDFCNAAENLDAPIFVHCKGGKRAGAMALMHAGVKNGWSGDETLEQAEQLGFECDKPELAEFIKEYVEEKRVSAGRTA